MRRFIQCALGACVIAATVILSLAGMPLQCPRPSTPASAQEESEPQIAVPGTVTDAEYTDPSEEEGLEGEDVSVAASSDTQPANSGAVVPSS